MPDADLFAAAAWIWLPEPERPNTYALFRAAFEVSGAVTEARLRISADARYEAFLDGEWLGHGPPRSWPTPWPVDEYDVRGLLTPGANVLAVQVHWFGLSTMQYLHAAPGLIAELIWCDARGEHRLASDGSWRCRRHDGFAASTQRIWITQGWEEQFDARREPGPPERWAAAGYDDSAWPRAAVAASAGAGAHAVFEARDIPFLTREPVAPARLVSAEAVRPAQRTWCFDLRDLINADDRSANAYRAGLLLATWIRSPRRQPIRLQFCRITWGGMSAKLEGVELAWDQRLPPADIPVADGELREGWNLLLLKSAEHCHVPTFSLNVWTGDDVELAARRDAGGMPPWTALGPFPVEPEAQPHEFGGSVAPERLDPGATHERYLAIWERGRPSDEDLAAPFARQVPASAMPATHVYAVAMSDQPTAGPVRVDQGDAVLVDDWRWTTVHPAPEGGDVRLCLDFGDEQVGFIEIDVDAAAGTIVDTQGFEFIQRDGRINLAETLANGFRYVCREGRQRWRSAQRRGFRFLWLILRGCTAPVRIRHVRVLCSTYPQQNRGAFDCSDQLLTRIWQVGARSVRLCSEDTYTDCPGYEQVHWVGDARNESLVDLVVNGDPRLSRHSWLQAARSLERSALVESHVPSGWHNVLPAWTFLWMRWAREYHRQTGDDATGREMLGWLERCVDGIAARVDERGLFSIAAWNMFDWAPMDTPTGGVITHLNCLAVLGLKDSAALAGELKAAKLAKRWTALAGRIAAGVDRHLWSRKAGAYVDCIRADGTPSPVFSQQTQTAAFIGGVARGARAKRCRALIDRAPKGFVPAGSPFYMFFVLEALAAEGRTGDLVERIRSYWGAQIAAGATTFWEMYYPDKERKTRSHCHGWSAAPTFFLSEHVLGVRPLAPGYRVAEVAPPAIGLEWADGRVPTPAGEIACWWRDEPGRFVLDLRLPGAVEAVVRLPYPGKAVVAEGRPQAGKEGGRAVLRQRGGRLRIELAKRR